MNDQVSINLPAAALRYPFPSGYQGDEELVIRPLALTDAPLFVAAIAESLPELRRYMPWAHHPQTVDVQRQRIIKSVHDYWTSGDFALGIYAAPSGRLLGGTGLHARTLSPKGLEIGYWIHSAHAGAGLATLATRCLIVYGFSYLGLTRVQCSHDAGNIGSAKVIDKCGFKIEGRLRNFDGVPSEEMRANGWVGSGETVMRALLPADIDALAWYPEVKARLTVLDWLGQPVPQP